MSNTGGMLTGKNEFRKEKQEFLDFMNQNPIPTVEEVEKFTRNMHPRLVDELKFIMTSCVETPHLDESSPADEDSKCKPIDESECTPSEGSTDDVNVEDQNV